MECPKCYSENYRLVRKDWDAGNGYNIDCQCQDCGYADFSKHYPHSLGYSAIFDPELFEGYLKKDRAEWDLKEEERRIEAGIMSDAWWASYKEHLNTPEWAAKRKFVLERDNYLCQLCLTNKAVQVHHLSYQTYKDCGIEFTAELVSVCPQCHKIVHDKTTPF